MKKRVLGVLLLVVMMMAVSAFDSRRDAAAEDGVLRVGLPSESPFSGLLNMAFIQTMLDGEIAYWMSEPLLLIDADTMMYSQEGAATYTYDRDAKTMTITMKPGVKWHDGEPVTMDDFVFAIQVLAHPDYDEMLFRGGLTSITGIMDYHNGQADSISGLVLSEDKNTLTLHFDEFRPSILEGGLFTFPLPRHHLGHVPVAEMAQHEHSRSQMLGFGPFKIENIVAGEVVEFVRFDDYWQGRPELEGVIVTIANPDMLPSAMERGLFDVAMFPEEAYEDFKNTTAFNFMLEPDIWIQKLWFRLGDYDFDAGENITNPNAKLSSLNLRRAMGYALDLDSIINDFYHGLYRRNPNWLPPNYAVYHSPNVTGFAYDPIVAARLLDEAGFIDSNGSGFRDNPDGSPLVIDFGVPNNVSETVAHFFMQNWRDVGLDVRLATGALIDFNAFIGMLFEDTGDFDMFLLGWFFEESPQFPDLWGRHSFVNFTRFTSDELDRILASLDSQEAWDIEYRIRAYHNFMEYFSDSAPVIPLFSRTSLFAVNQRVQNFCTTPANNAANKHLISLAD